MGYPGADTDIRRSESIYDDDGCGHQGPDDREPSPSAPSSEEVDFITWDPFTP